MLIASTASGPDERHASATWGWGFPGVNLTLISFFPSPHSIMNLSHLPQFNLSGTNVLSGAHNFVVNGTLNVAGTVRKMFLWIKVMMADSCRSTSRTTSLTDRHLAGLSLLCQTQVICSLAGQTSLPNSRSIFRLLPLTKFGGSTSCCMEWGALERPRFA